MADFVVQRVIFPPEPGVAKLYYHASNPWPGRLPDPGPRGRRSVLLEGGAGVSFESYFNCFFETHWRRQTSLDRLRLRLVLSGAGTVRLWRRSAEAGRTPLGGADVRGDEQELFLDVPPPRFPSCEQGAVHFDLRARGGPLVLHEGEWQAAGARPRDVGLVACYCTFDRADALLANLRALLEDPEVAARLLRIVVIDQGHAKVKDHPGWAALPRLAGEKVRLVEQDNYGGAGGFTRGILEARRVPGAGHVLLMDDDAVTEPESVLRAASFLALARQDLAVGGQMLDALRPRELYELTAEVHPDRLAPARAVGGFRLDRPGALAALRRAHTTRYNGWWFMAFPLTLIDRVGLPLPFFIRCDDIEFGCRLNRAGVPIAPLPGVGVWHEPFYLKERGWQNYYEFRNMLALCALHFPRPARQLVAAFLRRLFKRLLTHDYAEAWLLCEAVRDYCRGPTILEADPRARHQRLLGACRDLSEPPVPGTRHLPVVAATGYPHARLRRLVLQARCLWRQLTKAAPATPALPGHSVQDQDVGWWNVGFADVAVVRGRHSVDYRVLRRHPAWFTRLLGRGLRAAWHLFRHHESLASQWREAAGRLTSEGFWARYLAPESQAGDAPGTAAAGPTQRFQVTGGRT